MYLRGLRGCTLGPDVSELMAQHPLVGVFFCYFPGVLFVDFKKKKKKEETDTTCFSFGKVYWEESEMLGICGCILTMRTSHCKKFIIVSI